MARLYYKDRTFGFIFDPNILVYHERSTSTIKTGYKKVFKKTEIGVPVLFKPYMAEIALKNLSSPLGVSFLLMLLGASLPFIFILIFWMHDYIELIILSTIITVLLLVLSYISIVWIKTRRFTPNLFTFLIVDLIVRSLASSYGFYKYIFRSLTR